MGCINYIDKRYFNKACIELNYIYQYFKYNIGLCIINLLNIGIQLRMTPKKLTVGDGYVKSIP